MIKLFVMDVDGTMTDGRFTVDKFGNETKTFNVKDGTAIKLLKEKGIKTAVITGHNSKIVENRCKTLGIDYYYVSNDKVKCLKKIIKKLNITFKDVSYIGDDLNDLEIFKMVGHTACPNDACKEIKAISNYISPLKGGKGVIRDYVENVVIPG